MACPRGWRKLRIVAAGTKVSYSYREYARWQTAISSDRCGAPDRALSGPDLWRPSAYDGRRRQTDHVGVGVCRLRRFLACLGAAFRTHLLACIQVPNRPKPAAE